MTSTFISQQRPYLMHSTFRAQSIYHPRAFAPTKIKFVVLLFFFLCCKIKSGMLSKDEWDSDFGRHDQSLGCEWNPCWVMQHGLYTHGACSLWARVFNYHSVSIGLGNRGVYFCNTITILLSGLCNNNAMFAPRGI